MDLARNLYATSRDAIVHYARHHYGQRGDVTFVHSVTEVRTLKDEFDRVV